jgi:hypothetical protein
MRIDQKIEFIKIEFLLYQRIGEGNDIEYKYNEFSYDFQNYK